MDKEKAIDFYSAEQMAAMYEAGRAAFAARIRAERADFKNFHRLLCERFGYTHDERDWQRDQLSLIEHIAALAKHKDQP